MKGGSACMRFCPGILDEAIEKMEQKTLLHEHSIVIGDNASGKSELIRRFVKRKMDKGEKVYFIDSVNRYFNVDKIDNSTTRIEKEEKIIATRMNVEYFNAKDSFSMYGTPTECIEMLYSRYEKQVQKMLREFCAISFEVTYPKEKLVKYNEEIEGKLSNGIQALVRIFLEMLYLNTIHEDEEISVVIDELDEFLSPSNAEKIFPFLIRNFPQMKFVVSTHSSELIRTAKASNIIILYPDAYEIIDSNDFDSVGEVQMIFEKLFGMNQCQENEIEQKLRRLLNNRMMGAWGKNDENVLNKIDEDGLSNAQKILYRRIKEW